MHPDPAARVDLRELGYAEHLIVWTFRAFAVGRWRCPMIEREYRDACGAAGDDARNAVGLFAHAVQARG